MKLLLDECVVHDLKKDLTGHEVATVIEAGFGGLENGELLRAASLALECSEGVKEIMDHKLTVTLPEDVYQPLVEEASKQGRTPEEEASLRLQRSLPTIRPKRNGDIRKFFGMYKGGDPNGSDNEKIDADLARAYADNHEDED